MTSQDGGERNAVWERKREAYFAQQQQRAPASPLARGQPGPAGLPIDYNNANNSQSNAAALPPSSNPLAACGGPTSQQPPYQGQPPANPAHFQQEWESSVADQTRRY